MRPWDSGGCAQSSGLSDFVGAERAIRVELNVVTLFLATYAEIRKGFLR
jgi:hypothetical protein